MTELDRSLTLRDPDVELPAARLADFELVRRLAVTEGIASYLAIKRGEAGFAKRVLLKVADEPFQRRPDIGLRIADEARVGMHLGHPNLLQTLDLGHDQGRFFLVRQWVEGVGLRGLLRLLWREGATLPVPAVLRIGIGACRALGYLHSVRVQPWAPRGLVHRAVRPSNLLLSVAGEVRLANFSLARPGAGGRSSPVSGAYANLRRLPAYTSPEELEGRAPDGRADVYSLGAVLYEAIAGPSSFEGEPDSDWHRTRAWEGEPPLLSRPDGPFATLPESVRVLLKRALAEDREQRFQRAADLRAALQSVLRIAYLTDGDEELRAAVARVGDVVPEGT